MKKILGTSFIGILLIAITLSLPSFTTVEEDANGLTWYNKLDEAHEVAKKKNIPIFGFFTGSDWCGWCHKLQRDVFAKQAFIDWAKESVVLLELDFPKKKQLPEDIKKQNYELQQAFGVRGYPTVWLFNSEKDEETGKMNLSALGSLGYMANENDFIKKANGIIAKGDKK